MGPASGRVTLAVLITLSACSTTAADADSERPPGRPASTAPTVTFPPAPEVPTGASEASDATSAAWERLIVEISAGTFYGAHVTAFTERADARHAWLLADLLRFVTDPEVAAVVVAEFDDLTGADLSGGIAAGGSGWNEMTDLLIAWDTPAPPDYRELKGRLFTLVEPGWDPFFDDAGSTIDWRWVSWGGVFIDDRPLGDTERCGGRGCIPALDDPRLVPAADGGYYPDDAIVFGVTEGDEAVAFPKNVMQVHEMVNVTIGGRRFGIPYCTLCGSAQAYYTDEVPDGIDPPVLRTSGLLSRSNKVMYDLVSASVFDTFTGEAVTGPLREAGVVLRQNSVAVSTWGEWKAAHPETTIVAEDGGIGRTYEDDPLNGRDDDGPIFPIGDVDPRLAVQEPVVGVLLADGTTVAFPTALVRSTLLDGEPVRLGTVEIRPDGGGFVALVDGDEIATHEAFWFAWSQFHPDTLLWPDDA